MQARFRGNYRSVIFKNFNVSVPHFPTVNGHLIVTFLKYFRFLGKRILSSTFYVSNCYLLQVEVKWVIHIYLGMAGSKAPHLLLHSKAQRLTLTLANSNQQLMFFLVSHNQQRKCSQTNSHIIIWFNDDGITAVASYILSRARNNKELNERLDGKNNIVSLQKRQ